MCIHFMNIVKMFILSMMVVAVSPVSAHNYLCDKTIEVERLLTDDYKERIRGSGIVGSLLAQLYVNERTHTFSLIMLLPTKLSCIVVVGEDWEFTYEEVFHEDEDPLDNPD